MQKITPFLWFNGCAEEAARFYASIFKNSRIEEISRYGEAGPGPVGGVMSVTFRLEGQQFIALNGDAKFPFTPAISFFTRCKTQAEVDRLWKRLSSGGRKIQCGWLTDKFGITWQIVPDALREMLRDKDAEKSARVMKAMMKMVKLDIKGLERAYAGADETSKGRKPKQEKP
jgi:predicted 3-demethylubiquinone-9 3-methyltransferase (glyoxalase superfamily)